MERQLQVFYLEVRNAFSNKSVRTSMIKCAHGYNPYRVRCKMINWQMIESEYPRYSADKT